tara:strand:+ start:412 stop:843 length:432 start_codon:yes stop_codon:yes gene_type:complete
MDDFEATEAQLRAFIEKLPKEAIAAMSAVLNTLVGEVLSTIHNEQDVLFCGSNGSYIVKCLHYDRSVLGGEDGPVICPSSNPMVLLAAYSNEYIEGKVAEYRNIYSDPELMEAEWQLFLNSLAEDIAAGHPEDQPNWELLLES